MQNRWLVDTSVWINHFRTGDKRVIAALEHDSVAIHPWVIGELAVGTIPRRAYTLRDLLLLPTIPEISLEEILVFIQQHGLYGKGLSWVDVQLLASCKVSSCFLMTDDLALKRVAREQDLLFHPW